MKSKFSQEFVGFDGGILLSAAAKAGLSCVPPSDLMNKEDFLSWLATKKQPSANTLKGYRLRYDVIQRFLNGQELSQDTTQQFILHLREKGSANATINYYITVLSNIDQFLREKGDDRYLLKNIGRPDKVQRVPTILNEKELKMLMEAKVTYIHRKIPGEKLDNIYHLLFFVIMATGCRLDEALSLKKENLVLGEESYCHYKDTKTRKDRMTPIPYYQPLIDYYNEIKTDLVFAPYGHKIVAQNAERDWSLRLKAAGITKRPRIHDLRNSYIMEHIRRNTGLLQLSLLVGHNDPKTTLGYTKFNQEDIQNAARNHFLYKKSLTLDLIVGKTRSLLNIMLEKNKCSNFDLMMGEISGIIEKHYQFD